MDRRNEFAYGPAGQGFAALFNLNRKIGTTDYTEGTDKKRVTKDATLTLGVITSNSLNLSLSVFICAICGSIFFSRFKARYRGLWIRSPLVCPVHEEDDLAFGRVGLEIDQHFGGCATVIGLEFFRQLTGDAGARGGIDPG